MSYQAAGPLNGPPIVLVHGLASDSDTWEYAIGPLAARGMRVIAVDLPGHGQSDRSETGYLVDDFATHLEGFFEAIGLTKATIAGHSLGGAIAVHFGYHYPARVNGLVLVASGGLGREVSLGLRAGVLPIAKPLLSIAMVRPLKRVYGMRVTHRLLRLNTEQIKNLRRVGRSVGTPAGRDVFFASLRAVIEFSGQKGSFIEMSYLADHVPTLIVWAEEDTVIPVAHARALHEHLSRSDLVVFEGGGHEPHRRFAEQFADAVAQQVMHDQIARYWSHYLRN